MIGEVKWRIVAGIELALASAMIVLDLFIPTLLVLGLCAISLLARKDGIRTLGFRRVDRPSHLVLMVLVLVLGWTLLQLGLVMPVLSHITGTVQDLSAFEDLKGNVGNLAFLLLMTWTLAALGEEIVYRGFLQVRVREIAGSSRWGIAVAVLVTSLLFGIAHTEQGVVGLVVTALDAVFFSWVRLRFDDNLWAAVLAHGLSNTIGIVTFFLIGPIYGLW
jgi:membrane protease YdiL (CAAX protease family)